MVIHTGANVISQNVPNPTLSQTCESLFEFINNSYPKCIAVGPFHGICEVT